MNYVASTFTLKGLLAGLESGAHDLLELLDECGPLNHAELVNAWVRLDAARDHEGSNDPEYRAVSVAMDVRWLLDCEPRLVRYQGHRFAITDAGQHVLWLLDHMPRQHPARNIFPTELSNDVRASKGLV